MFCPRLCIGKLPSVVNQEETEKSQTDFPPPEMREDQPKKMQNDFAAKAGFRDVSATFLVWWESLMFSSIVHRGPRHREKT